MKSIKQIIFGLVILLVCLAASGCGPSPEELAATSAAETAAAVTDTPVPTPTQTPTPTPTPIPYDFSVLVIGEEDGSLVGATVLLDEIEGSAGQQITDDVGQTFWFNLPGETVNLTVTAQGYFPQEISETITRGPNQLTIKLERDPHGVLPSEACGPGEKLLYVEEFQDGEAQGWPEIIYRAQGWDIVPDSEFPDDYVLFKPADFDGSAELQDLIFDNAVWRLEFKPVGRPIIWFNLPMNDGYEVDGTTIEWSTYQLFIHSNAIRSYRAQQPISTITLFDVTWTMESNVWHQLEISRYGDTYEIWIDGNRYLKYVDPDPLPGGTVHFGVGLGEPMDPDTFIYYDDFVICELTQPFVPLTEPEQ
ncbi:MAG: carboxypeptidase-like regulatory domain-containing protein [Anaerolineales bacterium]